MSSELASREVRDAARQTFVDLLREEPHVLGVLEGVPAFEENGAIPGQPDLSMRDLVEMRFGLNGQSPHMNTEIASMVQISPAHIGVVIWEILEALRTTYFEDDPRVRHLSPLAADQRASRHFAQVIREYGEVRNLFQDEGTNGYFATLVAVPLYNQTEVPVHVLAIAHAVMRGEDPPPTIPTVRDFLSQRYGINTPRKMLWQMGDDFGFGFESLEKTLLAIQILLNHNCGTHFEITDASRLETYKQAETIEGNRQLILALESRRGQESQPLTRFSGRMAQLMKLGLRGEKIRPLLNEHLLSVTKYGAPPLIKSYVDHHIAVLRQQEARQWISDYDLAEEAAVLLESRGSRNLRTDVTMEIMWLLKEGTKTVEIAESLGLDRHVVNVIMRLARAELERDPQSRSTMEALYWELFGTGNFDEVQRLASTKKVNAIYQRLYPIYLNYRARMGDQPDENRFTSLSALEEDVSKSIAACQDFKTIAIQVDLREVDVATMVDILLNPQFGDRESLSEKREALQAIKELLQKISQSTDVWSQHYGTLEELYDDIYLLQLLEQTQYSRHALLKFGYPEFRITGRLKRIRARSNNILANTASIYRAGEAHWQES